MRFEVRAAFVIGILAPVLETCRRGIGHWRVDAVTMLEDYAAGGLLLFAAFASTRGRPAAALWMLLAWSAISGMMTMSFISQIEVTLRGAATEPRNALVILVKLLLWTVCMVALTRSFSRARTPHT